MLRGFYVFHDGTGTTAVHTPSFPRGGLSATFVVEAILKAGTSPTLVVNVEHKNVEDTSWSSAGTFSDIGSTGVSTKDLSSLKEEIRFAFTFGAGSAGDFFYIVLPAPAWREY